jgi:hypothetical protein
MTAQTTQSLVAVSYPPPPAQVEAVPDTPNDKHAVWIDGEWVWRNTRWMWRRGRWLIPPENGRFSPWAMVRDKEGNLYWAHSVWRAEDGKELAEPKPLSVGADVVGGVVDSDGNTIEQRRILSPPGTKR